MKRVIIAVLDSVGVGALPDAALYGEAECNTLGNVARALGGLRLPNLQKLGLGNIIEVTGVPPESRPLACYGKMAAASPGKDTTSGHWELAGIILNAPLPRYPDGFPAQVTEAFCAAIGRGILGNCAASGTEIIERLGREHLRTGKPIVYTSDDSVFQVAAHQSVTSTAELYEMCRAARRILCGEHAVGRVIARPFAGEPGAFYRTKERHDFSLSPPDEGLLHNLAACGQEVCAVGKVSDIFAGQGVSRALPAADNPGVQARLLEAMRETEGGLIFANFVDFDMLYGHRNDVAGYGRALEEFDAGLPRILELLREDDLLFLTADHGNDPTTPSTDHNREYVPLLACGPKLLAGANLGVRASFADLGSTAAEYLEAGALPAGKSFLPLILPGGDESKMGV